jgi:CRISPR-associated endonuclease/helicase Cas3
LSETEDHIFKQIKDSNQTIWGQIIQSWQTGNKSFARELIRDIHSINIVLVNEDNNISNLFNYESVSMHPFSLKWELKKILDKYEGELPNIAFNLQPSSFSFDEDDADLRLAPISLDKIEYENIVALNAEYIGYSDLTGLDFTDNFGVMSERKESTNNKIKIKYQYDTFEEHNNWMIEVFSEMYDYQYPLSKIKQRHYQEFDFDELMKFMVVCHDFGKLNDKWQEIVQKYQSLKSGKKVNQLLAHTDFDRENENDVELMKKVYKEVGVNKKPNHSGVGAIFVQKTMPYLLELKPNRMNSYLVNIAVTAILRHHSALTENYPKFNIYETTFSKFINYLNTTIPNLGKLILPKEELLSSEITSTINLINFQQSEIAFLYFLLVRILRLCDQKSFKKNPRKED